MYITTTTSANHWSWIKQKLIEKKKKKQMNIRNQLFIDNFSSRPFSAKQKINECK